MKFQPVKRKRGGWKKRLAAGLLVLGMVLNLSGCGFLFPLSEEEKVSQVVNSYLQNLQDGNVEELVSLQTSEAMSWMDPQDILDQIYGMDLSNEDYQDVMGAAHDVLKAALSGWAIDEVSVDGDLARVKGQITGVDLRQLGTLAADTLSGELSGWSAGHRNSISSYRETHSREETFNWIVHHELFDVLAEVSAKISSLPSNEQAITFDLVREGGKWKVNCCRLD